MLKRDAGFSLHSWLLIILAVSAPTAGVRADTLSKEMACAKGISDRITATPDGANLFETKEGGSLLFVPEKSLKKGFAAWVFSEHSAYKCEIPSTTHDAAHPTLQEQVSKFSLKIEGLSPVPVEFRHSWQVDASNTEMLFQERLPREPLPNAKCVASLTDNSKNLLHRRLSGWLNSTKTTAGNWKDLTASNTKGNDVRNVYGRKDFKRFQSALETCREIPDLHDAAQDVLNLLSDQVSKPSAAPKSATAP